MKIQSSAPRSFLKGIIVYLSIAGLVTFSLFICEEAFQTAMFGTWPAQDARNWPVVKNGLKVMKAANTVLKAINYSVGYIQPLAWFAYRAYGNSADYYIEALESKVLAHAPELYKGEKITLYVSGAKYQLHKEGYKYIVGRIKIISDTKISNTYVTGILTDDMTIINK